MLTLIDATGPYQLPTGWREVSTAQYCDLDRLQLKTVEARASYFAGRPIQVNALVADCLAFMLHPVPTGQKGSTFPWDLGQETFLQVEAIRKALLAHPLHECYGEVYGTFTARVRNYNRPEFSQAVASRLAIECMSEWPAGSFARELWMTTETYPAVAHCLAELARLGEAFAELAEPDPTEAAQRARAAGAEQQLGGFGHFGVADHYAVAKGMTLDQVYQTPWQTVALWMLKDRREAIVRDTMEKNAKNSTN